MEQTMNLKDLRYLIAIAEYKHFGKAAAFCFVSQPTLSAQIKKLEGYLGVDLIERTNKSVFITPIGNEIINRAKQIISDTDELISFARTSQNPLAGTLRIGTIPTIAPYLLPLLMPKIHSALPDLKPLLYEDQTHRIVKQINEGKLDVVILAIPVETGNLVLEEIYHEPFFLAASNEHKLAIKETVSITDIQEEKILLLEEGHCLRDHALEFCSISQSDEELAFRATSLETLRQMVAINSGISIFPALAVNNKNPLFSSKQINYINFNNNQVGRRIAVAWRKNSVKIEAIAELTATIKKCIPQEWCNFT